MAEHFDKKRIFENVFKANIKEVEKKQDFIPKNAFCYFETCKYPLTHNPSVHLLLLTHKRAWITSK